MDLSIGIQYFCKYRSLAYIPYDVIHQALIANEAEYMRHKGFIFVKRIDVS